VDGAALGVTALDGLGHGVGVGVAAAGLSAAAGELPAPGLAAGVADAFGSALAAGCGDGPPFAAPPEALGRDDAGAACTPGFASEPCETVMSARVKASLGWIGTNGAVAAYSGPAGAPGNGNCGAHSNAIPATIAALRTAPATRRAGVG
jgi:hypothetical protein